ncbi:MAG: hypothetical protein ACM3U1_00705 [Chloroflexota bacterium]
MKKFGILLTLLVLAGLGINSCGDNTNFPTDDPGAMTLGSMSATIDGSAFSSQQSMAVRIGSQISITGTRIFNNLQSGENITLVVLNAQTGPNTAAGYFTYTPDNAKPSEAQTWFSSQASVELTKITATEIQGRFSFVGQNTQNSGSTKNVSNGVFRARITY